MLDLYEELKRLVRELDDRGVPYALCGGLAMAVYHVPRATIDIDLLVPSAAIDDACSAARDLGYSIEEKPMSFAEGQIEIRRLSKVDAETNDLLSVDFVLQSPLLKGVWEDRVAVEWDEGTVHVVSRDGLIRMKELRGSGQDRDDIQALRGD